MGRERMYFEARFCSVPRNEFLDIRGDVFIRLETGFLLPDQVK
jgi:hypothetical protein